MDITSEKLEKQKEKVERLKAQLDRETGKYKKEIRKERERRRMAEAEYLKNLGVILDKYLTEKHGTDYTEKRTTENAAGLLGFQITDNVDAEMEEQEETVDSGGQEFGSMENEWG